MLDGAELKIAALEHVWPNFASRIDLSRKQPKFLVSGKGAIVYDSDGKEYIDGFSAILTTQCGHGREEIARAVYEQMRKLAFYPTVIDYFTEPVVELSERLSKLVPGNLKRFLFVNDGSEAVEAALKIAKRYQQTLGFGKRYKVVSRRFAYHGVTMGALSVNGVPAFRIPFEPLVPGVKHAPAPYCYRCEFGLSYPDCGLICVKETENIIRWEGPETIAAMILEPIMGAFIGFAVPPPEYLPMIRDICNRYGIVLIFDEVLVGFGRSGKMFACQHWNVFPDEMTISKGLASGYMPIGAVATTQEIASRFIGGDAENDFVHGHTFGGHTSAAVAGLANLDIFEKEDLVGKAECMGRYLRTQMEPLLEHPSIGDIRGLGMLFGIEFVKDKKTKERFAADLGLMRRFRLRCWELGLIVRNETDIIVLAPPFVITEEQADRIVEILEKVTTELEEEWIR